MGRHRYKPEDFSYGIIPYCIIDDSIRYLLIQHRAGHRAFPKGHPDGEESKFQTALRELKEETGLQSDQITIHDNETRYTEKYKFIYRGAPIRKTVQYLLGQCQTQYEIQVQRVEIKDFKWCTHEEALQLISFDEGRKLITAINNIIVETA